MAGIFISYRWDSRLKARLVFNYLTDHLRWEAVFGMDSIPPGKNVREHVKETLGRCDIMVAIVGPNWLQGLQEPSDSVRLEIETAIEIGVLIVPVLIDDTTMPTQDALPELMKCFAYIHAVQLDTGAGFSRHVDQLISEIDWYRKGAPREPIPPIPPPAEPEYFVSYAWGDDRHEGRQYDEIVDKFCAAAKKRNIRIRRDTEGIKTGQGISDFMQRLGRGDRIFVILSDKYLKSPNCMFELHEVWRNCKQDRRTFLNHTRVYSLPDAKIWTVAERANYAVYWQQESEKIRALIQERPEIFGESDFRRYRLMRIFSQEIGEIVATLTDILQPKTFEEFEKYGFADT